MRPDSLRPRPSWRAATLTCAALLVSLPSVSARLGDAPAGVHRAARERVDHDEAGDGTLWARGETWKASFSRDGALYVPFLGSDAPRSYPVAFAVASASVDGSPIEFDTGAAPSREDDVVRFARGAFDELWRLELGSVEQLFVFPELPAAGELTLRVSATTELAARETVEGFRFENELGAVLYGRATAFDARGASVAAPTTLTPHGIEIRVPASFVAAARFPLTVDPVVSTFVVDSSTIDSFEPDVAYDPVFDRWLTVYEERFSVVDHDVRFRLLSASGTSLGSGYAELSLSEYWASPAVAYNRRLGVFLAVAQTGTSPNRVIQGRRITNNGVATGSPIVISTNNLPGDKTNPDVGGDPRTSGSTLFCVVWEHTWNASSRDIMYRTVSGEGVPQGTSSLPVDNSSGPPNRNASISKSNAGEEWNVAWSRDDAQIRAARIGNTGTLVAPPFVVATEPDTSSPSASTSLAGSDRWLVAYQILSGGQRDIVVRALDGAAHMGSPINLNAYEELTGWSTTWLENQFRPDIDSDGETFTVVYAESVLGSTTNLDVYATTLALTGTQIAVGEGHRQLSFSLTTEDRAKVASRAGSGGALQRYGVVWQDVLVPNSNTDIEAGLYDAPLFAPFCLPGLVWVGACPCSNPPSVLNRGCNNSGGTGGARLTALGTPSLAADGAVLTSSGMLPSALSVFNQGNLVLSSSVTFGQGVRCVGGSLKRLYTKTASVGVASAPAAGDASISARSAALGDPIAPGSTRGYYVYYRDPVVLGGCPSGSTFNTTQSLQAVWVP